MPNMRPTPIDHAVAIESALADAHKRVARLDALIALPISRPESALADLKEKRAFAMGDVDILIMDLCDAEQGL